MSDDPRVHDALTRIAEEAPAGDSVWETTQRRIARRRRRRAIVVGVAAVVVLALGGATVAAIARGDDDGPNVAVQPPAPTAPDHVVAVVNGRLVVMSTTDASSRQVPAIEGSTSVAEVSTVPGSSSLVYTANYPGVSHCPTGPKLIRADEDGTHAAMLVGASMHSPLVSPDGRSVAYEMRECAVGDVGVTTLPPNVENFRFAVPGERPLAWTLDSKRLLVVQGEGEYSLAYAPLGNDRTHPSFPAGAHAAAFTSDNEVALAVTQPGVGDEIATYDLAGGNKRTLMTIRDYVVTTMSFDPTSGMLLVVATDKNGNGSMSLVRQGNAETRVVHGLTAAAWYDPPSAALHTTSTSAATAASTSTPASAPTTTVPGMTTGTLAPARGFAGATEWVPVDAETDASLFVSAPSPQAKVDALVAGFLEHADQIEGGRDATGTVVTIDGNAALIEVRVVGFPDDSVGGAEYHVLLAHDAPGGDWRVAAVESRSLCRRGVDQASNLCV